MPTEFDPESGYSETREGQDFLVYVCGCYAYMDLDQMRVLPCCPEHEKPVVVAVRAMLTDAGLFPTRETRETLVKN